MGIDRHRLLPLAPPRQASLVDRLIALLGGPKGGSAPAPEPTVLDLLDQLAMKRRTPLLDPRAALAVERLSAPGQAATAPAGAWQEVAAAYAQASPAARAQLTSRLTAGGITAAPSEDGRYLTFQAGELRVTAEPASGRLRRRDGDTVLCYEGERLAAAMKVEGETVEVTTEAGSTRWTAGTGQATSGGLPVVPRYAAMVPGEPARAPWATPLRNDLQEPRWTSETAMTDYAPAYDRAVLAAGGQVAEPSDPHARPADLYNCHSFATTGGEGDLFDPFLRESHPHWINNPMHQLLTGPFSQLRETQRVHPGDVIVYRKEGRVTHTGIVREVDADGNPSLIESKYGVLGRYMHEPFDIPASYGAPAEFFRPEAA